jgi:hypothetical protein
VRVSEGGEGGEGGGLVGTVLAGRYRILSQLGEGAMGAVYLGEHLRIGRRDAIKVLRPSLAGDAEAMARFGRGVRNVSRIHHANVCTVYDFGDTEEGRGFLAMEYVPGGTLADLLQREGRLPASRAVEIARQAAAALQAAHDAGIVHRDLKPGNLMVAPGRDGADVVKVVDFDIAKGSAEGEPGDVTRVGFVVGTPEYMSPEQLLGEPLDGRSDVYSLGLVLFRMLAGALPFRAPTTQDLLVQRLTIAPLPLADVLPGLDAPHALQDALDRALQRRPDDRFASAAEFARAIEAAVASPSADPPSNASPRPRENADALPPTVVAGATAAGVAPEGVRVSVRARWAAMAAMAAVGIGAAAVLAWGAVRSRDAGGSPRGGSKPGLDTQVGASSQGDRHRPPKADSITISTDTPSKPGRHPPPPPPRHDAVDGVHAPTKTPVRQASDSAEASAAHELAYRLERELDGVSSPDALRGLRDRAQALYDRGGVVAADRALAAYVAGDASSKLGEPSMCAQWMERSVALHASRGAQLLLDHCRLPAP